MRTEPAPRPRLIERLEASRERHKKRSKIVRALYVVAGLTVLGAGVAMLVLPGPALAVIPVGLFMLALEFTWAEALLHRAIEQGEIARQKAAETSTTQRILVGVATALAVAGFAVWALLADIPVLPIV